MPSSPLPHKATGWLAGAAICLLGLAGGAAALHRPAKAERKADSCPLTVAQEVAAVKAFKGFAPIFREPRCLNCHGAVNPFAEDGGHPEFIDIREEAKEFLRRPDLQDFLSQKPFDQQTQAKDLARIRKVSQSQEAITDNDAIRPNAQFPMEEACERCHIEDWVIPFKNHQFINKSDEALCIQMKTSEHTNPPDRFLQHMQADKLVLVGFKGTRGLESAVTPKPPAMPFATLEKYVNDWVEAMDGKFHQPPDCGCKIHGFVLQIHHRIDTNPTDVSSSIGEVDFSGDVEFAVRLTPVPKMPDGWFTGQASVVRPISVHHVRPDCSGKSPARTEDWDVRAMANDDGKSMKFLFTLDYEDPVGTLTCKHGGMSIDAFIFSELTHREDMMIPTTAGAKAQFRAKEIGAREWLTVTVLQGSEPEE